MITNKRTVSRHDQAYMILFANPVRVDGDVEIHDPITGLRYRMPGRHWNDLLNQQHAAYHGILRVLAISPADPELTVL